MSKSLEKVVTEAINILSRREYTRWELGRKLLARDHPADLVEKALDEMEKAGYVDDREYARRFQETRDEWGYRRLRDELARRGISRQVLDETLVFDEDEEFRRALCLVRSWKPQLSEKQIVGRLLRRGFREDVAKGLARKSCGETS